MHKNFSETSTEHFANIRKLEKVLLELTRLEILVQLDLRAGCVSG